MHKNIFRKGAISGIVFLVVSVSIVSALNAVPTTRCPLAHYGLWLYVGGSGPGNYTTIQSAINAANPGDTVFVYSGTYVENVVVDTSLTLEGEEKGNTIIDASKLGNAVEITADGVVVSGFTMQHGFGTGFFGGGGIKLVNTRNCTICDNIIVDNDLFGICVTSDNASSYTTIAENIIAENGNPLYGGFNIWLYQSPHNTISNNTITNGNGYGIGLCYWSTHSIVTGNMITDNKYDGIKGRFVYDNEVYENMLRDNMCGIGWYNISEKNHVYDNVFESSEYYGIFLRGESSNNIIERNNFIDNKEYDAYFYIKNFMSHNKWKQNYWSKARVLPKPIFGLIMLGGDSSLPWVNVDWQPAQQPYNITLMK